MKNSEFKLTVKGEEATGMSTCAVEFDGTPAQFMDAVSSALAAAKNAFIENFDGEEDALSVFKESVVEFMDDGFVKGKKAFRDIALDRMKKANSEKRKASLKESLDNNEDIKNKLRELIKELEKAGGSID